MTRKHLLAFATALTVLELSSVPIAGARAPDEPKAQRDERRERRRERDPQRAEARRERAEQRRERRRERLTALRARFGAVLRQPAVRAELELHARRQAKLTALRAVAEREGKVHLLPRIDKPPEKNRHGTSDAWPRSLQTPGAHGERPRAIDRVFGPGRRRLRQERGRPSATPDRRGSSCHQLAPAATPSTTPAAPSRKRRGADRRGLRGRRKRGITSENLEAELDKLERENRAVMFARCPGFALEPKSLAARALPRA